MGALTLLPPGRGGPCTEPCSHESCEAHRRVAATPCSICGQPLGFGVPVYCYKEAMGHAAGIEDSMNRAFLKFAEGMMEIALDHLLKTEHGYTEADLLRFHDAMKKELPESSRATPIRILKASPFLLPSPVIHLEIPSGRTRKPTIRVEDHTTVLSPTPVLIRESLRSENDEQCPEPTRRRVKARNRPATPPLPRGGHRAGS